MSISCGLLRASQRQGSCTVESNIDMITLCMKLAQKQTHYNWAYTQENQVLTTLIMRDNPLGQVSVSSYLAS